MKMAKHKYPSKRAPRVVKKAPNNKEAWDQIHGHLTELMFMMSFYRSNDEYIKMTYGGNLKSLYKIVTKIQRAIEFYGDRDNDVDI